MNDLSAYDIVNELNHVRAQDYPVGSANPDARAIEHLLPSEIAVLALVDRWDSYDLDYKMGDKTIRQHLAEGADLRSPGSLEKVLAGLAAKRLLDVDKRSGFFSSKIRVSWTDSGRRKCYAYLNRWGWELLAMALQSKRHSGFGTGPPIVGGPGMGGWSSSDI